MLDDDHGVALVAQFLEQLGQAVHVAGVEADARLVEDVHHVDEAAAEVLHHLDPLRLAARERGGLAVQAQVVEPDVDHVLEPLDERRHHRSRDGSIDPPEDPDEVADLHRRQIGDGMPADARREGGLAEASALAQGARLHPQVGLDGFLRPLRPGLDVAPDILLLEFLDDAEVGGVHRLVADPQLVLAVLAVQEEVHLLRGVVGKLLVVVEEAGRGVGVDLPTAPRGDLDGAFVERLGEIDEAIRHDADLPADAVALGAHALGIVERERVRVADVRFAEPGEEEPQHGIDVRDSPDRRGRSPAEAFLVDDDGHAQVLDRIGVRLRVARQEVPDEEAEVLEQLALRLGRDRVEHD